MKEIKVPKIDFVSGELEPHPLDIGMFKYECVNVLGMDEMPDEDAYELAYYLIEHYYTMVKADRKYLRYSVVEA